MLYEIRDDTDCHGVGVDRPEARFRTHPGSRESFSRRGELVSTGFAAVYQRATLSPAAGRVIALVQGALWVRDHSRDPASAVKIHIALHRRTDPECLLEKTLSIGIWIVAAVDLRIPQVGFISASDDAVLTRGRYDPVVCCRFGRDRRIIELTSWRESDMSALRIGSSGRRINGFVWRCGGGAAALTTRKGTP